MYLKSIRAQGFKSFADKLDLEIKPGITGIVGPNGSGKSNIVDAVRWVLGEQSAKSLRSNAMSDVIFNGSASREAQKRAYVALVFDNADHYLKSDFKEIEVKRVVYSSGENEYFLNNTRVRLKDVKDLFMESGAGSGDFNIISQGNVTDIVNSKSSDRRLIFEATAHVLKYKERKEESLKKLAKTEENLLRINLIIKELETTITPLKEESEKAEKYLAIKKELEAIDIALICEDITKFNEEYQNLKKEIDVLQEDITSFKTTTADATLEKLKAENLTLDDKINNLNNQIIDLTKKLSNLNSEKKLTLERQKYNLDNQNIDETLIKLKEAELETNKQIALGEASLKDTEERLNQNKDKKAKLGDELIKERVTRTSLQNNLLKDNQELFICQNKIEILTNNIASDASSPLPVKSVLNNPRLKGIHNTLAALIQVEDTYLTALEVALGYNKNFLVVENENGALEAINYLKNEKLGRATFLPLNIIKGRSIPEVIYQKLKKEPGFIDTFNTLITFDKKYQNIIDYQLGNVLVVKNDSDLKKIAKIVEYKYKVVSLDGNISNVGGSMTGGVVKTSGVLLEKSELNKLKAQVTDYNSEIALLNEKITKINAKIATFEAQEEEITKKINEDEETYQNLVRDQEKLKEEADSQKSELEGITSLKNNTLNDKVMVLLEEINIVTKDIELKEKEKQKLIQEKDTKSDNILTLEKQIRENNALYNAKISEINLKEVEKGKIEVKLDNLLHNLNEEYSLTYEAASSKYSLDMNEDLARKKTKTLKKDLAQIGEINIGAISEYERLNKRFEFLTNQREDLTKASSELKDIIASMDEIMIEKFAKTFKEVKQEFARIFKLMFKGGHGELKLSDPDDLLHTGIDIIAIPPGKKINSPLSLSGGEKALTAICLLFAMLEVRPSPFIILDEAEAALDEANVDMFGAYLNNEKQKSQFILITHKKRMMEYADALYGITMQESGVSKIVSTKLEN